MNNKEKIKKSELFQILIPFIKGKDVLDIGCVEHNTSSRLKNPFWIHQFLKDNCNVLGIDILKEDVKTLCSKGYNMKVGNAETFNLRKKFNVIFAGELIEHLSNPGLFIQQSKKHLKDEGLLILTTPNTFYVPRMLRSLAGNDNPLVNEEHTSWFSPSTLQTLLGREGFKVIDIKRFEASTIKTSLKARIKKIFNKTFNYNIKESLLVIAQSKSLAQK